METYWGYSSFENKSVSFLLSLLISRALLVHRRDSNKGCIMDVCPFSFASSKWSVLLSHKKCHSPTRKSTPVRALVIAKTRIYEWSMTTRAFLGQPYIKCSWLRSFFPLSYSQGSLFLRSFWLFCLLKRVRVESGGMFSSPGDRVGDIVENGI